MKKNIISLILCMFIPGILFAQAPSYIKDIFPAGTVVHQNISYAGDTLKKHLLDIYLPSKERKPFPLIVWIHGGAWKLNDKYADMSYMRNTIRMFIDNGYALASIDYRHSTTAIFPAQIQDCMQALGFLSNHSDEYGIDAERIGLIGFSAGGHLGSLIATSLNNSVREFYPTNAEPSFRIRAVADFYGPADLMLFFSNAVPTETSDPISTLLGTTPILRPDVSKKASPVTYVDQNDPPFFIVHGEKDRDVPVTQSYLFKSYLELAKVPVQLTVVRGAPHYGEMFDAPSIREKLLLFLNQHLAGR